MYSILMTVVVAGGSYAPVQGYGGYYGGYSGYAVYDAGHMPYAYHPAPYLPCFPYVECVFDSDEQSQKEKELQKKLDDLKKHLHKVEGQVKKSAQQIKNMGEQLKTTQEGDQKLEERVKILAKTLELKLLEARLNQKETSLKEKEKALEAAERLKDRIDENLRQEAEKVEKQLIRLEDKLKKPEPLQDAEARHMIHKLAQKIATLETLTKTKRTPKVEKLHEPPHKKDFDNKKPGQQAEIPANRALITVRLPADAKLFLDGQPTKGSSDRRSFLTPELQPGTAYSYTFQVEFMRNRQWKTQTQRVYFRAGNEVLVSFDEDASQ